MILQAMFCLVMADVPASLPARIQTRNLSRLTFRQAQQLDGQPARVAFTVDSLEGEDAGCVLVDAESVASVSATIRFAPGLAPEALDIGTRFIVEGQMMVRIVPGRFIAGQRFEAGFEIEVRGAGL